MVRHKPARVEESRFAPLTERDVKAQTDSGSFSRGRTYFRNGHIRETVLRGDSIEAFCDGSDFAPYRVQATLAPLGEPGENPRSASCTCPRGGFCKHIVALLLAWVDDPGRFIPRPPVTGLLAERSRDDLVSLIERMIGRYPDLGRLVDLPVVRAEAGSANEVTIDEAAIRRQARSAFALVDSYDYRGGVVHGASDIYSLLELGHDYAMAGQWANAQAILTILFEETGDTVLTVVGDEGDLSNIVAECDAGLAACLGIQAELPEGERLSAEARERLLRTLYDIWRFDIFEAGGLGIAQEGPHAIARNVTDGERAMVEGWLRAEEPNDWSKRVTTGFLVMLREEAGLDDEQLLEVYREAELWDDVAGLLLKMGRVDEAVAVAGRHLKEPYGLVAFANALIERGPEHVGRALSLVDDHMWEVEGAIPMHDYILQDWLIDRFSEHDRPREALAVAERRFKAQSTLQAWQMVRRAAELPGQAPDAWADLRPKLLTLLRKQKAWSTLMEIHLEEGEVPAAIEAYAKQGKVGQANGWYMPSWGYVDQELRLAEAAEVDFPDQAVAIYRQKAEAMIANRQRSSYKVAAEHLARTKETLVRHGRTEEWETLIAEVRARHKTLRALREELDALDLN